MSKGVESYYMSVTKYTQNIKQVLIHHGYTLGGVVVLVWVIEFVDAFFLRGSLDFYGGIKPRTLVGLRNIFIAPFLHANFGHLVANTFPFLILGAFVLIRRRQDFLFVTIVSALASGLGVWLFGAGNSVHVGLSGVIFGYMGYLLLRAYFERSMVSIALAVLALIFCGGMIFGLLPFQRGISWLGHIFGFLGGGASAYLLTERQWQQEPIRQIS